MKYKERRMTLYLERMYAKQYVQKVKQIIWEQFHTICEIESQSFDYDDQQEITLYFLATDEQLDKLVEYLTRCFDKKIKFDF